MRFLFFLIFIACYSFSLEAQYVDRTNFRAGLNAGLVVGDFSEEYRFILGVDFLHHWGVSRKMDLGIATGFSNAFGETQEVTEMGVEIENKFANRQFIPAAGSIRIYPSSGFKIGADLGYAIGVSKDFDGGFYYRPTIAFDMNDGTKEFNISYQGVNGETGTYSSVLAGFLILF